MQINTISGKKVQVITKTATPYNVNGVSGITYRVGVLSDGDVEKIKVASEDIFNSIETGKEYYLEFAVVISNGSVREPKVCGAYWDNPLIPKNK